MTFEQECMVYNQRPYIIKNTLYIDGMAIETDCHNCKFEGNLPKCKKFHLEQKLKEIKNGR